MRTTMPMTRISRPRSAAGEERRRAVLVATAGTLIVAAYAVFAALQIFVWNPLAAVQGKDLAQIEFNMRARGESFNATLSLGVLAFGIVLAIVLFVLGLTVWRAGPWGLATCYLGLVACGTPAYFLASFIPGMALADTYGISGADHSPWSGLLYGASALAVVALVATALVGALRSRRHAPLAV